MKHNEIDVLIVRAVVWNVSLKRTQIVFRNKRNVNV